MAQNQSHQHNSWYHWYVLIMLTVVSVFAFIDRQLIIILQEAIKEDLGLTDAQLGFVSGLAFSILYVIVIIPIARLADRSSRKNIITMSLAIWSLITALTGLAANYIQLAFARIGVGLGEAGAIPASHAIIADYFPQEKRSMAYAVHGLGVYIGLLFGFALGGILEQLYGWRTAFYIIGIPGLLFSMIFYWTIKEPQRQLALHENDDDTPVPSVRAVFKYLSAKKTFIFIGIAVILHTFVGSAFANWMPPLLSRVYGMDTVEIGLWLALAIGVFGALGTYLGGYMGDRFSQKDIRWYLWLPTISILLSMPFALLLLLTTQKYVTLCAYLIPNITYAVFLGPTYAIVQMMVGSQMRATASAIVMILISLFGLGLGPYLTGVISDMLAPTYGDHAVRWSLLSISGLDLIAAFFFYQASKVVKQDIAQI